jgi:hypothetical protein
MPTPPKFLPVVQAVREVAVLHQPETDVLLLDDFQFRSLVVDELVSVLDVLESLASVVDALAELTNLGK